MRRIERTHNEMMLHVGRNRCWRLLLRLNAGLKLGPSLAPPPWRRRPRQNRYIKVISPTVSACRSFICNRVRYALFGSVTVV
jgi:hypothetical protein